MTLPRKAVWGAKFAAKPMIGIVGIIVAATFATGNVNANEPSPVTSVEEIDLDRYCGIWYEIARLPNRFQRECTCCSSAEYTLLPDGKIRVVNSCRKADGSMKVAEGIARRDDPKGSNARLKVRFAPSWLGWLPFIWGTYWIIDLPADYSYAVVGEPSRKYLWILSKTPNINQTTCDAILDKLKKMGYDTDKLIFTRHD